MSSKPLPDETKAKEGQQLIPLHRLTAIQIDPAAEIRKIMASGGHDRVSAGAGALSSVHHVYRNMKTLGFFKLVAEAEGNRECVGGWSQRVNDLFEADTIDGHIFFVVEITHEALEAFLDDGLVLAKLRDWLIACYRQACSIPATADPLAEWNRIFSRAGSPLPKGVRVLPFYNRELAPGIPAVVLVLVLPGAVSPAASSIATLSP